MRISSGGAHMRQRRLRTLRGPLAALLAAALAAAVAGCAHPKTSSDDAGGTVVVDANRATTLDFGGGAHLIIPPGAVDAGAKITATFAQPPAGTDNPYAKPLAAPVKLTTVPANALHGLLTLEFPVDPTQVRAGSRDNAAGTAFGIRTLESDQGRWEPVSTTYDPARHMVVATIPHFSWYQPLSWDFDALYARVAQDFGQALGARKGPPDCQGRKAPEWVSQLAGVASDADVAVRSCARTSKGDVLDVKLVNNRSYGQVLTYGSPVEWGWHEPGNNAADKERNRLMDSSVGSGALYLPPLSEASVGIRRTAPGSHHDFVIGPTPLTVGVDLTFLLVAPAVQVWAPAGSCAIAGAVTPLDARKVDVGQMRDWTLEVGGCLLKAFDHEFAAGNLNHWEVGQLDATFKSLRAAEIVGRALFVSNVTWPVGDLLADAYVSAGTTLKNGFTVWAKADQQPDQPSTPPTSSASTSAPPADPPTQPPTTPATTRPPVEVTARVVYSNYGDGVGHAICRGNLGRPESMPGGTVSQTFTVPAGTTALTSATVQIDPSDQVLATLSVSVNGSQRRSAQATAAGDTNFDFDDVAVSSGDRVELAVSFSATAGKIVTVYSAGNPGGRFTVSNSCPDGAGSYASSDTGLRAVVHALGR